MKVSELKEALKNVPDDYDVTVYIVNGVEALWRDIDMNRTGLRGMVAAIVDPPPEGYRDDRPLHSWAASARVVMWKGKNFGEFWIANGYHCPRSGERTISRKKTMLRRSVNFSLGRGLRSGDL